MTVAIPASDVCIKLSDGFVVQTDTRLVCAVLTHVPTCAYIVYSLCTVVYCFLSFVCVTGVVCTSVCSPLLLFFMSFSFLLAIYVFHCFSVVPCKVVALLTLNAFSPLLFPLRSFPSSLFVCSPPSLLSSSVPTTFVPFLLHFFLQETHSRGEYHNAYGTTIDVSSFRNALMFFLCISSMLLIFLNINFRSATFV